MRIISDKRAVLGLPMRMVVSIIIGAVALAIIIGIIYDWLPPKNIYVDILSAQGNGDGSDEIIRAINGETWFTVTIVVRDTDGNPVHGATVTVTGLGGGAHNVTNKRGIAICDSSNGGSSIKLPAGSNEGYLDLYVSAPKGYNDYFHEDRIEVIRV